MFKISLAQPRLRIFSAAALSISIVCSYYFLYRKYHALSVCETQYSRLDAIEADLSRMGR